MAVQKKQQEQKGQGAAYTPAEQRNYIQRYNDTVHEYIAGGGDDKTYVTMSGGPGYSISAPNGPGYQANNLGTAAQGQADFRNWNAVNPAGYTPPNYDNAAPRSSSLTRQEAWNNFLRNTNPGNPVRPPAGMLNTQKNLTVGGKQYSPRDVYDLLNGTNAEKGKYTAGTGLLPQAFIDNANQGFTPTVFQGRRNISGTDQTWDQFVRQQFLEQQRFDPDRNLARAMAKSGQGITYNNAADRIRAGRYTQSNMTDTATRTNPYQDANDQYAVTRGYDPAYIARLNINNPYYDMNPQAFDIEQRAYAADPSQYTALRSAEQGDPMAYYYAIYNDRVHGGNAQIGDEITVGGIKLSQPDFTSEEGRKKWAAFIMGKATNAGQQMTQEQALEWVDKLAEEVDQYWGLENSPINRATYGLQYMRSNAANGGYENLTSDQLRYYAENFREEGKRYAERAESLAPAAIKPDEYAEALFRYAESGDEKDMPEGVTIDSLRQFLLDNNDKGFYDNAMTMPEEEVVLYAGQLLATDGQDQNRNMAALGIDYSSWQQALAAKADAEERSGAYGRVGDNIDSYLEWQSRYDAKYGAMRENPDYADLSSIRLGKETDTWRKRLEALESNENFIRGNVAADYADRPHVVASAADGTLQALQQWDPETEEGDTASVLTNSWGYTRPDGAGYQVIFSPITTDANGNPLVLSEQQVENYFESIGIGSDENINAIIENDRKNLGILQGIVIGSDSKAVHQAEYYGMVKHELHQSQMDDEAGYNSRRLAEALDADNRTPLGRMGKAKSWTVNQMTVWAAITGDLDSMPGNRKQ